MMQAHCSGPSSDERQTNIVAVTTAFDVTTDMMSESYCDLDKISTHQKSVASFPVLLLWNVKISARQKFGLSAMLSLSLVMAIFAITRIAGTRLPGGPVDIIWLVFWQQQECSIAVIMFSMTAFRSFFVGGTLKQAKAPKAPTTYWRNKNLFKRSPRPSEEGHSDDLPAIPSATLTGMRTMIEGSGRMDSKAGSSIDQEMLLA